MERQAYKQNQHLINQEILELAETDIYHEQLHSWLLLQHDWQKLGHSILSSHLTARASALFDAFKRDKEYLESHQQLQFELNSSDQPNASNNRSQNQIQANVQQSRMHRSRDNIDREYLSFLRVGQSQRALADFIDILFYLLILFVGLFLLNFGTYYIKSKKGSHLPLISIFDILEKTFISASKMPIRVKINFLIIAFVIEVFSTHFFGASLGKYMLNLEIVSSYKVAHNRVGFVWVTPGTKPKFNQIITRSIFKVFGLIFFPIFHLTAMSRHRTFYDTIAATLVVGKFSSST